MKGSCEGGGSGRDRESTSHHITELVQAHTVSLGLPGVFSVAMPLHHKNCRTLRWRGGGLRGDGRQRGRPTRNYYAVWGAI